MSTNVLRPRSAIILFVEHNQILRVTVRDVLEFAGWYVKESDAIYARAMLECGEQFDLLVIDNDGRYSGLELIKVVRRLPH